MGVADRDLIEHHLARVIGKPQALKVHLSPTCEASAQAEHPSLQDLPTVHVPMPTITLPCTASGFAAVKCIKNAPTHTQQWPGPFAKPGWSPPKTDHSYHTRDC